MWFVLLALLSLSINVKSADDYFFYNASIKCTLNNLAFHTADITLIEVDPGHVDRASRPYHENFPESGFINKTFKGSMDGDGFLAENYDMGVVIKHNCRSDKKFAEVIVHFAQKCKIGRRCYLDFDVDVTNTVSGVWKDHPARIRQW